jgi:hypothetical protein
LYPPITLADCRTNGHIYGKPNRTKALDYEDITLSDEDMTLLDEGVIILDED